MKKHSNPPLTKPTKLPKGELHDELKQYVLLDTEQAAEILRLSRRTLEGLRVSGGGPKYVHISERCVRYRLQDLLTWIESRVRSSTSGEA